MLTDQQLEIDAEARTKWLEQRRRFFWLSFLTCFLFLVICLFKLSTDHQPKVINGAASSSPASTSSARTNDESELDHFTFFNNGDPAELREWVNTSSDTWEERYPNGHKDQFKVVQHTHEKGFGERPDILRPGIIVRKVTGDVEVFIPDHGVTDKWAAIRSVPNGSWRNIRPIDREEAEQIPAR